jgi:hypothetical protein
MSIEEIRIIGAIILVLCIAGGVALWRFPLVLSEEPDSDEMCCEPDYSYDLNRYVHADGCSRADADTEYLRNERA